MTEKIARKLLRRFYYHHGQLQKILNDAHNRGLIAYPSNGYDAEAPCSAHWDTRIRFEKTTQKQIADAVCETEKKAARTYG